MMSGFTGSIEENPPGGAPFNRGFHASCPSCGDTVQFEILLDLYNTPCRSCGTYAILYFWGKEEGPHMTEDLAYMFCAEGLMTEEHLENALQTKRQSEPAPLIELLLSIQYVTVPELEDLARRLIPDEWVKRLSGEQYIGSPGPGSAGESTKLVRPEVDALYSLLDQIYSGCGHPFSRMTSETLERRIRALGGDLTAGDIRNHFGALLLSHQVLTGEVSEPSFARLFSRVFDLDFDSSIEGGSFGEIGEKEVREFAEHCALPLDRHEDILKVGIPGHLLALGFEEFFRLSGPEEIRQELDKPVEFSIMPVSDIQKSFESIENADLPVEPEAIDELIRDALEELGAEITTRYQSLNEQDQPVAPGQEAERPASTLRAIFQSLSLVDEQGSGRDQSEDPEFISVWLYSPQASGRIPEVVDRVRLDELVTWADNQLTDREKEDRPGIPEREKNEVHRLSEAFVQLRQTGEVQPDKLNLPVEILDAVTKVEAGVYEAIPVARAGGMLWFAISDPETKVVEELSAFTGEEVRAIPANAESVKEVLVRCYGVRKGEWVPEHTEENLEEGEDFEAFLEVHGLPAGRSEVVEQFPERIADELEVVPLEITPEDLILACKRTPDFMDRQLLHLLFRRSVSYRFVSEKTFRDLHEQVYSGATSEEGEPPDSSGSRERWSQENLEEMIGAPLSLEDIQMTEDLLKQLKVKKRQAPDVQVVTEHEKARSLPPVYEEEGRLKIREDVLEELPSSCWTPAMETFFPVLPIQETASELLFASSSLDRRWFLELLGLFTNRPVHVIILPKSTIEELSRRRKGGARTQWFDGDTAGERDEHDSFTASDYLGYQPSHLFESFHELAEENQLKKFILLLLVYLFEHDRDALRIVTEDQRCSIQRWRLEEGGTELFSIDNAHIYGLRYAFQEMAGEPLSDFRSDQHASFDFVFRGEKKSITFEASAIADGQELILSVQ